MMSMLVYTTHLDTLARNAKGPSSCTSAKKKSEAVVTAKELAGACEGCHEDGETVGDGPRTWIS